MRGPAQNIMKASGFFQPHLPQHKRIFPFFAAKKEGYKTLLFKTKSTDFKYFDSPAAASAPSGNPLEKIPPGPCNLESAAPLGTGCTLPVLWSGTPVPPGGAETRQIPSLPH